MNPGAGPTIFFFPADTINRACCRRTVDQLGTESRTGGNRSTRSNTDRYAFLPEQAIFTLCEHFKVKSLDGVRLVRKMPAARSTAAGGQSCIFKAPTAAPKSTISPRWLRCAGGARPARTPATQADLELVESRGAARESLEVLDRTSPRAHRKLRAGFLQPVAGSH